MIDTSMQKSQLLSPPDGKVVETLTDARTLSTALGVLGMAFGEKTLYASARNLFGVAAPAAGGKVAYYAAKADGSADTSQPSEQFRMNRNIARAVGVVGCVAGIEYSNNGPVQYALLGGAALLFAHIVQDAIPALR